MSACDYLCRILMQLMDSYTTPWLPTTPSIPELSNSKAGQRGKDKSKRKISILQWNKWNSLPPLKLHDHLGFKCTCKDKPKIHVTPMSFNPRLHTCTNAFCHTSPLRCRLIKNMMIPHLFYIFPCLLCPSMRSPFSLFLLLPAVESVTLPETKTVLAIDFN